MTLEPTDQPHQENAPLVPILPVQDGAPDSVSVSAWHLALSNLVGLDVPHDLLGLWLFPDRGGVILLAPSELGQDHLEIQPPSPFVSQHHLFELEERVRQAGYRSVVAVPVRGGERDLGLVLFAALDAGRYGVVEAVRLHAIVKRLQPDFVSLAAAPPVSAGSAAATDITPQNAAAEVAVACAEGRSGTEVLRLVSGVLQAIVPHERIEVAVPGSAHGVWALLSGIPEGRRWGESTAAVSQAVAGLVSQAEDDGSLILEDLREGPGLVWPSYRETRSLHRIRAVAGVRLHVAGSEDAWLFLGGPASGMFRQADREVLLGIAPVVALRVQALRAQLDAEVTRAQAQAVSAAQARATRIAAALSGTAHWGEAVSQVARDVRESLGYREVRFALRLGDDRFVRIEAGDLRPISTLTTEPLESTDLATVLSGLAAFLVHGEGGSDLAVPLRVAGRVVGALELLGGAPGATGHPVTAAQLVADLLAPHLELMRRSALPAPVARPRREGVTWE